MAVCVLIGCTAGASQLAGAETNGEPQLSVRLDGDLKPVLDIRGIAGSTNQLQYASGVTGASNWTALVDFALTSSSFSYVDTNAGETALRFYRVVRLASVGDPVPEPDVLYVARSGNDDTAVRGRPERPWGSVTNALAAARNGDAILVYPGTYPVVAARVTRGEQPPLTVMNKTNLFILGVGGGVRICGTNYGDIFSLSYCENIVIAGLTIEGRYEEERALVPHELSAAIALRQGCARVTIENNTIIHHNDHGIAYLMGPGPLPTNNIVVRNNYIEDVGGWFPNLTPPDQPRYDGSAIVPMGGWLVENNHIRNCARGIEPYPNDTELVARCVLRGNTIINTVDFGISSGGSMGNVDLVIEGNHIETEPGFVFHGSRQMSYASGIDFGVAPNIRIRNNTVMGYQMVGVMMVSSVGMTNALIEGNVIRGIGDWNGPGIMVGNHCGNCNNYSGFIIRNNIVSDVSFDGIVFQGRDAVIEGNILSNAKRGYGDRSGIRIRTLGSAISSNIVVSFNRIYDMQEPPSTRYGILIEPGSVDVRLFGNIITGVAESDILNQAGCGVLFDAFARSVGSTNIANYLLVTNTIASAGFQVVEGANAAMGMARLSGGLAMVYTSKVTENSRIFLTVNDPRGEVGTPYVLTRQPGLSFLIKSSAAPADESSVAWLIVEPRTN